MSVDGISSDKHMSTNISLSMGTLSSSCFYSLQAMWVDGVSQMTGTVLDGSLKYIISETAPGADDQDKLWIKLSGGAPVRQYVYYNGAWVWPICEYRHARRRQCRSCRKCDWTVLGNRH